MISEILNKKPYFQALQLFRDCKNNIEQFSPTIQSFIRESGENDLLCCVSNFTDSLINKYIIDSTILPRVIISKIAKIANCEIIAPTSLRTGLFIDSYIKGSLKVEDGKFIINTAPRKIKNYKESIRFTIAHEIVHTMFYKEGLKRYAELSSERDEEFLCDYGACRLLLPDNLLIKENFNSHSLLKPSFIIRASKKWWVPYKTLCSRLFDPISNHINSNLNAIILWKYKYSEKKIDHESLVPLWAVARDAYIPMKGKCHVKKDSVIYSSFIEKNLFYESNSFEDVNIGTLKGKMLVDVCAFG
ncbi:hypothetical protein HQ585_14140, partial [candidate division KSB1 bacterium]|nr:hypothetical protein [candidate division KSB1 bacterium]